MACCLRRYMYSLGDNCHLPALRCLVNQCQEQCRAVCTTLSPVRWSEDLKCQQSQRPESPLLRIQLPPLQPLPTSPPSHLHDETLFTSASIDHHILSLVNAPFYRSCTLPREESCPSAHGAQPKLDHRPARDDRHQQY